jgi:membrane-associated protease RseP (regulator of RpoE activity)
MKGRNRNSVFYLSLPVLLAVAWLLPQAIQAKKSDSHEKAWLGVSVSELSRKDRKKFDLQRHEGVRILYVIDDSPADYADLESGDIILAVNGDNIKGPRHFSRLIRNYKPGDSVTFSVIHDGKDKKVKIKLEEYARDSDRDISVFSVVPGRGFSFGFDSQPYLGVYLQELNKDLAAYFKVDAEKGVLITEVEEDSPAEEAGLKPGDILANIDGEEVDSPEEVMDILRDYDEGEKIEVTVIRSGEQRNFSVELGESDSDYSFRHFYRSPGRFKIVVPDHERFYRLHYMPEIEQNIRREIRQNIERNVLRQIRESGIRNIKEQQYRIRLDMKRMRDQLRNQLKWIREDDLKLVSATDPF